MLLMLESLKACTRKLGFFPLQTKTLFSQSINLISLLKMLLKNCSVTVSIESLAWKMISIF